MIFIEDRSREGFELSANRVSEIDALNELFSIGKYIY